jgi:hypothetical protein
MIIGCSAVETNPRAAKPDTLLAASGVPSATTREHFDASTSRLVSVVTDSPRYPPSFGTATRRAVLRQNLTHLLRSSWHERASSNGGLQMTRLLIKHKFTKNRPFS